MWELIPGVVVAVPLPQPRVPAVSCVMASQSVPRVVGHCIQVVHRTLCREKQHCQPLLIKIQLTLESTWEFVLPCSDDSVSSSANTHRCSRRWTPACPALWEGSWRKWRVCWLGCSSLRNASDLRGTLSQGAKLLYVKCKCVYFIYMITSSPPLFQMDLY